MQNLLTNKVAIITGASQGLGLEISRQYLIKGASIMLCARSAAELEKSCIRLAEQTKNPQRIHWLPIDVSSEADVDLLIRSTIDKLGHVDILINNAGIYGPKGDIEEVEWCEWVDGIHINLFGSILMCRAVLPFFKKQRSGKIIQISGGGATNPLPRISAYAVSKVGIVRFMESLAREVQNYNIDVNSISPGALNTRMLDEIIDAGPESVGKDFYEKSLKQKKEGGAPLNTGAELSVFLGSDASNGITGKLISAVWDNWEDFPKHLDEIQQSDVYTLRRITGRDRGMNWGDK